MHSSAAIITTGLVFHSIADGVALGASLYYSIMLQKGKTNSLGALIFLAILVHKIPASVGLGTILTKAEQNG